ncbi:MAG: hypothetical protein ACRELY_01700 [Polyangiaceae bacterium]
MKGPPVALTVATSALHVLPPLHDSLAEQSSISAEAHPPSSVERQSDPVALGMSNGHICSPSVPARQQTLVPPPQSDDLSHLNESAAQVALFV